MCLERRYIYIHIHIHTHIYTCGVLTAGALAEGRMKADAPEAKRARMAAVNFMVAVCVCVCGCVYMCVGGV